jgi:hypothetical protein
MPRNLPTIPGSPHFKIWARTLAPNVQGALAKKAPWQFKAEGKTDGILLTWATVVGADGYEIWRSEDADFSTGVTVIPIPQQRQDSYFDALGATSIQRSYKILSTSGTLAKPHTVRGPLSGIVTETSGSGTSASDTTTTDQTQSTTRFFGCVLDGTEIAALGGNGLSRKLCDESRWIEILLVDGNRLVSTLDHPVYCDRGKVVASELEVGERVVTLDGLVALRGKRFLTFPGRKVIVTVEKGQLFWANRILSHNKIAASR